MCSRTNLPAFICFPLLFGIYCLWVTKGGIMPLPPLVVTLLLVPWVLQLRQSNRHLQCLLWFFFSFSFFPLSLFPSLRSLELFREQILFPLLHLCISTSALLRPFPSHFFSPQTNHYKIDAQRVCDENGNPLAIWIQSVQFMKSSYRKVTFKLRSERWEGANRVIRECLGWGN